MTTDRRTRRPRGAGTVRNRGSDRAPKWFGSYSISIDGKRRQISKGPFRLKAEAESWLKDELRRKDEGRATVPKRITVGETCDEWLTVAKHRLSPNTVEVYSAMIDQRIRPLVGHVKLVELRPSHVARMIDQLRQPGADRRSRQIGGISGVKSSEPIDPNGQKGLSNTSVLHTLTLLSTICKWAVKQRYISYNPCADVDRPKREESEMSVWDADQLRRFLLVEHRLAPMFRLLAMTGMRRSEALALKWTDLDLDTGVVSVRRARVRVGSMEMVDRARAKTKRGQRSVDLDPTTVAVLKRWRTAQHKERLAWGPAWTDTGYVFTNEAGLPLSPHVVETSFRRLTRLAGNPSIRLHDLRHTHATMLLTNGVPVHIAAARLGHKAEVMLSTYAHVLPQAQAEAAAAVAGLVDDASGS